MMRATTRQARWQPARHLIIGLLFGLAAVGIATASPGTFRDFDGQTRSISDYTGDGRWLLVMIWRHDCHVCEMEVESYAQFHLEHYQNDAHVLGLSIDGAGKKAAALDFIERHDVPFPNLIGELRDVAAYYQTLAGSPFYGTPSILLFDPEGKPRAAQAGAIPLSAIEAFIARHATPQPAS